jgi:tRNA threonylcarbamoyladenosine biosynthesis protein TsaB
MMEQLLAEAGLGLGQLDALAFGRGPGSFTGVRIATGTVQGAAFGAGLPVVPVSTLAALAQRGFRERGFQRVLPAYDARMNEVYWAGYRVDGEGLMAPVLAEEVVAPGQITLPEGDGWHGVGSGWKAYQAVLSETLGPALASFDGELLCSAQDVVRLAVAGYEAGSAVAAEEALPVYLRDRVAWRKPG